MYYHFKNNQQDESFRYEQENNGAHFRTKKSGNRLLKKVTAVALSAAIFGAAAGGTFYGMNEFLLGTENSLSVQDTTSSVSLSYVSDSNTTSQSLDVSNIAALGLPSVVSVTNISVQQVENYFGRFGSNSQGPTQMQETVSCGSGVIIYQNESDLYMITNYHVVEDASTLSVTFVDDETYEAQLYGYDETKDLALLKVSLSDLTQDTLSKISVVSVGDSNDLIVGEQVVAIGNALGYGQSVTTGIVSAVDRTISSDSTSSTYIQTDAAINPGNSGGALLNMDGELIGINTAKISSTGVEGMGYAIPISQVVEWIGSLML